VFHRVGSDAVSAGNDPGKRGLTRLLVEAFIKQKAMRHGG
jgi:hypothetical protein